MKKLFIIIFPLMISVSGCKFNGNAISNAVKSDITPPTVSITSPVSGKTYGSGQIIVQGSAADDLEVIKVETCVDNGVYSEANTRGFSSSSEKLEWISYVDTSFLTDGTHVVTAKATDLWDNITTVDITIIVDDSTPLAMLAGAPPVMTDSTDLNVSVSGNGITHYKYKIDTGDWVGGMDGIDVSIPITASGLGAGKHTLWVVGKKEDRWQDATTQATKFTWSVNTKLYFTADDGADGDGLGGDVAISSDGKTIVAGASGDDKKGSVYVYSWTGSDWIQTKLTVSDGADWDYFGGEVAISSDGNTIVIGASGDDDNGDSSGAAYVFCQTGSDWIQTKKLTAANGAKMDRFGWSVTISSNGSTIVVGAYGGSSAYVFSRAGSDWNQTAEFKSTEGEVFGCSVAISSDSSTIVVGAEFGKNNGSPGGSAYVFSRAGSDWNQTAKLAAADGARGASFGYRVAVSSDGNTVVAGAYGARSAYVFNRAGSDWNQAAKLMPIGETAGGMFGASVAVSSEGSTIAVGAYGGSSAYVFSRADGDWIQTKKLTAAGGAFGGSEEISSDGNTIIVGASGDNSGQGAAYLFYQ